jgi:S-adenosylmethionine/arginine decarboxylase-like enzyme
LGGSDPEQEVIGGLLQSNKNKKEPFGSSIGDGGERKIFKMMRTQHKIPQNDLIENVSGTNGLMVMKKALAENAWGIASSIDIYGCNPETIRDADAIKRFVAELCVQIEMKRFGETQVVHFGEDERVAGFSMVQLIETSLISAHFANQTNTVYLDVFSCKAYNPEKVQTFSQTFFEGTHSVINVTLRK